MIDNDTRSRLLPLYPMLGELPAAELKAILATAKQMQFQAGTVIFDENQPCQGFPLLLSGSLRVIKSAANGRELQLYRVLPGESCILTSSCLLGHNPYQARGIVEAPLEMVMLP
ncbi:MAG: transcriptional regulator, partial [Gallionellales bacterium CG_4_10_14_3_um_filter_54_96]